MSRRSSRPSADSPAPDRIVPVAPALQIRGRNSVRWDGRDLLYFGGCDYYRLARHPRVKAAVTRTVERDGLNVAASRKTTGNHELYVALEAELADFFGADAAMLTGTGYAAPQAAVQSLAGRISHVFLDARAHGCLQDAARWTECPRRTYAHRDAADLHRQLAALPRGARPLVMTDGMYSHDGSLAPLGGILASLPADGWLICDDAHAAGVIGPGGRGTPAADAIRDARVLQTITLSKALGAYGGAVLGSHDAVARVVAKAGVFVGNTPVPLPFAAAARASLILLREHPEWQARLLANAGRVRAAVADIDATSRSGPGPVVPLIPPDPAKAERLSRALLDAGIHPPWIRYPGGPEGGYFRFAFSQVHSAADLSRLVRVLRRTTRDGWRVIPTGEGGILD